MVTADWRLVSMWEGEPVGVDPRRPIVGFVLVAVLCAVLMAMSVGRGFGVDLIRPGKPISSPPARAQAEPPAGAPAAQPTVSIPDELSSQPYAVVGSGGTEETDAQQTEAQSEPTTDRAVTRAERKAALERIRDAVKAQREADREAAKAERDAAKADRGAAKDAAKAGRRR
jgi:hypothetical protein